MRNLFLSLLLVAAFSPSLNAQCINCPECGGKVAVGFLEKSKDKKTVYEVTQEEIAVPDICMPKPLFKLNTQLQKLFVKKCCPGQPCGGCEIEDCPKHVRGGQVRVVKVLKKASVECNNCSYRWEVTDIEKVNEYLHDIKPAETSAIESDFKSPHPMLNRPAPWAHRPTQAAEPNYPLQRK